MIGGEQVAIKRLDPVFVTLAPGVGEIDLHSGREKAGGTAEQGYLHCGPDWCRTLRENGTQRY